MNTKATAAYTENLTLPQPVVVWIDGGGFLDWSGSAQEYDGTALARRGRHRGDGQLPACEPNWWWVTCTLGEKSSCHGSVVRG